MPVTESVVLPPIAREAYAPAPIPLFRRFAGSLWAPHLSEVQGLNEARQHHSGNRACRLARVWMRCLQSSPWDLCRVWGSYEVQGSRTLASRRFTPAEVRRPWVNWRQQRTSARPDIANWLSPRERRPTRTCFLSSQTNAIEGFSAPPIGNGHHAKMSSSQKAGDAKFQFEWER